MHLKSLLMNRFNKTESGIFIPCAISLLQIISLIVTLFLCKVEIIIYIVFTCLDRQILDICSFVA